jgi:AraC-like DNA-binding protein
MRYEETPAPPELSHVIKASWALDVGADASETVVHFAIPDGCMEVIRRLAGRSEWQSPQPDCFVAGVITRPAELRLSGDSRFVGLRVWPWTWNAIGLVTAPALIDRWAAVDRVAPGFAMPATATEALQSIAPDLFDNQARTMIDAILVSKTVAELRERCGRSPRSLQRWFQRNLGLSARSYLRLQRFSNVFEGLPQTGASLAGYAADHGFADQPHMAREFRSIAGASAARARKAAIGPFL